MSLTIKQAIAAQATGYEGDSPKTIKQAIEALTGTTGDTIAEAISNTTIAGGEVAAFVVSFSANGGTGTVDPVACADGFTVKLPAGSGLTKSGYRFAGWAESSSAEAADYAAGDAFAATEAATLYAFWVAQCTLTYDANGGTGTVDPVTVDAGSSIALDDGSGLTKSEKAFAGWGTTDSAEEPVESPYKVDQDTTLYAIWEDAEA